MDSAFDKGWQLVQVAITSEEVGKPAIILKDYTSSSELEKGYYGTASSSVARAPRNPNVILVVVDTLRADHLGCYGGNPFALFDKKPQGKTQFMQGASPAIDVFAKESAVFDRAYSSATATNPSIASIFTSLPVTTHGVFTIPTGLSPKATTLAEVLHDHGYRTTAVYSSSVLDDLSGKGRFSSGFSRGFESYRRQARMSGIENAIDRREGSRAEVSVNLFLQWINERRKSKQPFFGWLHLMDPHRLYEPPPPFNAMFTPQSEYVDGPILNDSQELLKVIQDANRTGSAPLLEETDLNVMESLYYGEISYTSAVLSVLFNKLNEWDLSGNTLVILTADHGESMTEHDFLFSHGYALYQDITHIPLIIRCPWIVDGAKGLSVHSLVSNMDIMPTILDIAGIGATDGTFGQSLVPLLRGEKAKVHDYVFSEICSVSPGEDRYREVANAVVSDDGFHSILVTKGWVRESRVEPTLHTGEELYDLNSDPGEAVNLTSGLPRKAAELRAASDRFMRQAVSARRRLVSGQSPAKRTPLSEEQKRTLEALGYL